MGQKEASRELGGVARMELWPLLGVGSSGVSSSNPSQRMHVRLILCPAQGPGQGILSCCVRPPGLGWSRTQGACAWPSGSRAGAEPSPPQGGGSSGPSVPPEEIWVLRKPFAGRWGAWRAGAAVLLQGSTWARRGQRRLGMLPCAGRRGPQWQLEQCGQWPKQCESYPARRL